MPHVDTRVYIIGDDDFPYVKIGVSKDPENRCRQINTYCPARVGIIFSSQKMTARKALQVERIMHDFFSLSRSNGEWFNISHVNAISAFDLAKREVERRRNLIGAYNENQNKIDFGGRFEVLTA